VEEPVSKTGQLEIKSELKWQEEENEKRKKISHFKLNHYEVSKSNFT
jgi:hypothetical protein